jgi:hypothetical protein
MFKDQLEFLIAFPLLVFVYLPRPPLDKAQFLTYPSIAILLLIINFLLSTKLFKKNHIKKNKLKLVIYLLLALSSSSVLISFLINTNEIRATAIVEIGKPLLFAIVFTYGYNIATIDYSKLKRSLLLACYYILVGQCIITAVQIYNPSLIHNLYSIDKLYAASSLRINGSLANPNLFAWVISFISISGSLLAIKKRGKYLLLGVGSILVFLSSSRTMIILYPVILLIAELTQIKPKNISLNKLFTKMIVITLVIGILLFFILTILPEYSPYFKALIDGIKEGNVTSINSLDKRTFLWNYLYNKYFYNQDLIYVLFGVGSRAETRVVDNDYLYVFYRLGLTGFLIHLWLIGYSFLIFIRTSKYNLVGTLGIIYLIASFMFGMMSDHLGGWFAPLFWFLLLGFSGAILAEKRNNAKGNQDYNYQVKRNQLIHH